MSDQTVEVTINKVFDPQPGTRRPWNILAGTPTTGEARYSTFQKELADVARANIGNRGKLKFREETKDGYNNLYFEGFEPIQTLDAELTARPNGAGPNYRQPTHPGDQASMRRALALQRAHEWLPYLDNPGMKDVLALAEEELKWLESDG